MEQLTSPTPHEFGRALREARERAGIPLDLIVQRTKIARRTIEAFEEGRFDQLPAGVFPRLFLRQILSLLHEDNEPWQRAFDAAWQRLQSTSQPIPVVPAPPQRGRRVGPWVVGSLLVAVALAGVALVEWKDRSDHLATLAPTASTLLPALAPTVAPTAVAASAPNPTPRAIDPNVLAVRAAARACWVQVTVAGERPVSRLVAASTDWEVPAQGRDVDLVLGDAGAVEIDYLGQRHANLGGSGEVVRLHLGPRESTQPRT